MNRMLRIILGPIAFGYFMLSVIAQYMPYAGGIALLGQSFSVIGSLWVLAALLTLGVLLFQCFVKGSNDPFGKGRFVWIGIATYCATHGTAKLWIYMSANCDRSVGGFTENALFFIVSLVLLVSIPVCFALLVGTLNMEKKKKKDPNAPEKPLSVGKPTKFKSLSGQWFEMTTTYYKKEAKVEMKPISV